MIIIMRNNKISGVMIDDIWCSNEETLKKEAYAFFKDLFSSPQTYQPNSLMLLHIPKISEEDAQPLSPWKRFKVWSSLKVPTELLG